MANTNLIYTYIQDSGYKLQYVASVQILKPGHLLPGADAAPQHRLLGGGVVGGGHFLFAEHRLLLSLLIL